MAPPSREEQCRVEELWEASRRTYGEARRRQNCVEWITHHQRLAQGCYARAARHEREKEKYEVLLKGLYTTDQQGAA